MKAKMEKYQAPIILTMKIEGDNEHLPPGEYDTKIIRTSNRRPDGTINVDVVFLQCLDCPFDGFVELAIQDKQACEPCIRGKQFRFNVR